MNVKILYMERAGVINVNIQLFSAVLKNRLRYVILIFHVQDPIFQNTVSYFGLRLSIYLSKYLYAI